MPKSMSTRNSGTLFNRLKNNCANFIIHHRPNPLSEDKIATIYAREKRAWALSNPCIHHWDKQFEKARVSLQSTEQDSRAIVTRSHPSILYIHLGALLAERNTIETIGHGSRSLHHERWSSRIMDHYIPAFRYISDRRGQHNGRAEDAGEPRVTK